MVRGGRLGLFLILPLLVLLVPVVSATLTMDCPTSAQATHPFTISATDNSATTIKLFTDAWYSHTGTYFSKSVTENRSMENQPVTYYSKSYDSSGNLLDSTYCDVNILSANFPGTASASPTSLSLVVGQAGRVTVSVQDDDGIKYAKLGNNWYTCYTYNNYPTTCWHTFTISYDHAGTYTLVANEADRWNNAADTTSTVTVTVSDPCRENPPDCDDGNPCTTDTCVVQGGQATCAHDAVEGTVYCTTDSGENGQCDAGVCKAYCAAISGFCTSSTPQHSTLHTDYYCSAPEQCFTCDAGFHPECQHRFRV